MELVIALIGLATAGVGAWTAYRSRPGPVAQAEGYGMLHSPGPYVQGGAWPGAQPIGTWRPPGYGQLGPPRYGQTGYVDQSGPPGPPHGMFPPTYPGFAAMQAPPVIAQPSRRYRVATAVRDAGIIFAITAVMGFFIGLGGADLASILGVVVVINLVVVIVGFAVAGVLAGRDRWRHLLVMGLVSWVLGLLNVVLGVVDVVGWLGSVFVLAFIVGLTGLFATLVHRLRAAQNT